MHFKNPFILALSILAFVIFGLNAFYVWSWGDDYFLKLSLLQTSPINYLINDYLVFDGRSLNLGYLISRICLSTEWPFLATVIASIFYFASACILVLLVHLKSRLSFAQAFVLSVFFTAILWLAGFYSHAETLYWQTGMLYVVEVFLIYAAYAYLQYEKSGRILVFILSVMAGIASPGAILAYIAVLTIEYFNTDVNARKRKWLIAISGTLTGLVIVLASPGNKVRFMIEGGIDKKAFGNIHELYFRLHQFMDKFFYLNTPMVWLIILASVFFIILNRNKTSDSNSHGKLRNFIYDYRWMIAAVISLLFYFPRIRYYLSSPRLNIHFVFFAVMFFALHFSQFRSVFKISYDRHIASFQVPVLMMFIVIAFYQLWGAMHCVKKIESRIELYNDNRGKDLILKANDLIGPPATREFLDVNDDTAYQLNKVIAKYYGLNSLIKEKYR